MAEDNEVFIEDDAVVLEDTENSVEEDADTSKIIPFIMERYHRAEDYRRQDEERWLKAYRNYRGIYGPDVQFTEAEKSRVFIKVTKTKTLAAYGQIVDVLFGNNKFPLSINPSVLPDGVAESVHINIDPNAENASGAISDAMTTPAPKPYLIDGETQLQPGETLVDLQARLAGMQDKLAPVSEKIIEGEGTTATTVTFHPAMVAAKKMEKKIKDQLEESSATKHLRHSVFECVLFGTAVMKGPFALDLSLIHI